MGYIIIDEDKLRENVNRWNSQSYKDKVMSDVTSARVNDYSHLLEALQQAEKKIDEKIQELEGQKNSINSLMRYV